MDTDVLFPLCDELLPLIQTRYRFMEGRWWVNQDGYWTRYAARDRLQADIRVLAQQYPAVARNLHKSHYMSAIISRFSTLLTTYVGLPARSEPMDPQS